MIGRLSNFFRRWRGRCSRSEWARHLLAKSAAAGTHAEPGLLLVQVDGLGREQFETALRHGRLPFLQRLHQRRDYQLLTFYSGLPSSTPAVQGELFYGVPGGAPGFGYVERESGAAVRLHQEVPARRLERCLAAGRLGLLAGGAAYSDVLGGGAAEVNFCAVSHGWQAPGRPARPWVLAVLAALHGRSIARLLALVLIELGLGLFDFVRGSLAGYALWQELKFIGTRVGICILLRELVTFGARLDVSRGLPVVHVNFLGYDEQAHRRGPDSAFAHWTLKGIDDAIGRIWAEARRSVRRDYEIWVYSDHGQERVADYTARHGRPVHAAIAAVFAAVLGQPHAHAGPDAGHTLQRISWLFRYGAPRWLRQPAAAPGGAEFPLPDAATWVTAVGPHGNIYPPVPLSDEQRTAIARRLVSDAGIPLVLAPGPDGGATAWTAAGQFELPRDLATLAGADHPFLAALGPDLVAMTHHPDAGALLFFGWRHGVAPLTFAGEAGAHGGFSPAETRGFALLPRHVHIPTFHPDYLRPAELRQEALAHLRRVDRPPRPRPRRVAAHLRLMSYNIHSCLGVDGKASYRRIFRVIHACEPDVVCLQEVDAGCERSSCVHQAERLAGDLHMKFVYHPIRRQGAGWYGTAILSRLPMTLVQAGRLGPGVEHGVDGEERAAVWVEIETDGGPVQVVNVHLGLRRRERLRQVTALLGDHWLGRPDCPPSLVLAGDFNALPGSPAHVQLVARYRDLQAEHPLPLPRGTWFPPLPLARLDHIFAGPPFLVKALTIPQTRLTRRASDHLPVVVDLELPPERGGRG